MRIGIIDIETTGFLDKGGLIIEIGIASLHIETGEIRKEFESVCREESLTDNHRHAWIFKNSDLTYDEVCKAPLLLSIAGEAQECIDSFDAVTAYNKKFDFGFLRDRDFKIGKEWPCPMHVATPICKIPGMYGDKWPSVEEAWKYLFPDEPYIEQHRGADDAMHEAKIVYELYKRGAISPDASVK